MGWAGGKVEETPPGTRVRVSGLNHDVMEDDIKELFSGVGELLHCEVRSLVADRCPKPTTRGWLLLHFRNRSHILRELLPRCSLGLF